MPRLCAAGRLTHGKAHFDSRGRRTTRASGVAVLEKAVALARCFGAHIELLVADSTRTHEFASRCTALVYDDAHPSAPCRARVSRCTIDLLPPRARAAARSADQGARRRPSAAALDSRTRTTGSWRSECPVPRDARGRKALGESAALRRRRGCGRSRKRARSRAASCTPRASWRSAATATSMSCTANASSETKPCAWSAR